MSTYNKQTKHPVTNEWEVATQCECACHEEDLKGCMYCAKNHKEPVKKTLNH